MEGEIDEAQVRVSEPGLVRHRPCPVDEEETVRDEPKPEKRITIICRPCHRHHVHRAVCHL